MYISAASWDPEGSGVRLNPLPDLRFKAPTCLFVRFDYLRPINTISVIKVRVFLGGTTTKLG